MQLPKSLQTLKPGTRVLFACVPLDGHFNPLTGLARYLAEQGCDVRWYTSVHYRPKTEALGQQHYPFVKAMDVHGDIDALFPERSRHRSQVAKLVFDLVEVFILRSPEYFEDLKAIHSEFPFEAMVCDIAFGGSLFVTDKMRIPVFAMGILPLTATSRDLPPAGLGMTPSSGFRGRRRQDLLRFVADRVLFARPNRVLRRLLREHRIEASGTNIFDIITRKATRVLQSGVPGFEYKRSDLGSNIRFVGALLPHRKPASAENWYDPRLDRFDTVIVVTQGTVEKDAEKLLVPTLEAFRGSDTLVVCTTGGSQTDALRARFPEENIIIEDFIPFDDIMPYADAYVTNGGYGGTMIAIEHQLPLIAAGLHEGKNEINARVGYFGIGIDLKTEKPKPGAIREAVDRVLHNPGYPARVRRLSGEFGRYPTFSLCAHYMAELLGAGVKESQLPALAQEEER
ncbi:glycosyltransferase [Flaviaesturariibacter flavus]|uniref:Glycosyltransferase n=1 Tax=Flaviaesturariibacter flavus TaxID=2502780 RepID=A0A4R1BKA3_9BACT|nr:glycosyltransferase [Flaviaesturariibacter flavus]TCJ17736.1 glycosyltransferase [Flaviaesturariibacter flavus]